MPEPLGEISAVIPFGALIRIRLEFARLEEQFVPACHADADIERKRQLVRSNRIVHGRHGVEIGPDRECVVARDLCIVSVRHRRIEPLAVAASALGQGVDEFVVGPGADARDWIGSDIRRHQVAEWRFDRASAGEVVAASRQRVARRAIAGDGEVIPALDLIEILFIDGTGRLRGERPKAECRTEQ